MQFSNGLSGSTSGSSGRSRGGLGARLSTLFAVFFSPLLLMSSTRQTTSARQSSVVSKTPTPLSSTPSAPAPSSSEPRSKSTASTDFVIPLPSAATRQSNFDLGEPTRAHLNSSTSSTTFIFPPSSITAATNSSLLSGTSISKRARPSSAAERRKSLT